MQSQSEYIKSSVEAIYREHLVGNIDEWVEKQLRLGKDFYNTSEKFRSLGSKASPKEIEKYETELFKKIEPFWFCPGDESFERDFSELNKKLDDFFASVPLEVIREQLPDRFIILEKDRGWLRVRKRLKKTRFRLAKIPLRFCNFFRKLFRYRPLKIHHWKHSIPLQGMASRIYRNGVLPSVLESRKQLYEEVSNFFVELKKWEESADDQSFDFESARSGILEKRSALETVLVNSLEEQRETFDRQYFTSGTLELPSRCFKSAVIQKEFKSCVKRWNQECSRWQNTLYALFEEWRTDLEITILKFAVEDKKTRLDQDLQRFISHNLEPKFAQLFEFVTELKSKIHNSKSEKGLTDSLESFQNKDVSEIKKAVVNPLSDILIDKKLIGFINSFQLSVNELTERPVEKRVVVSCSYDKPISDSELHIISPKEFISFETLPKFEKKLEETGADFFQACQKTYAEVLDIDKVIAFSISSALDSVKEEKGDLKKLVLENLDRSVSRIEEIRDNFKSSVDKSLERLDTTVDVFQDEIWAFTDNENILNLRLRISKAKALKRSKRYREELLRTFKRNFVRFLGFFKKQLGWVKERIGILKERFVLTAGQTQITKEVSNFLSESQHIIDGLPVIYKRLYSIEPLVDLQLFEGRQKEFDQVQEAYKNWKQGNYSSTVIIGEKWSGLTSFINYIIDRIEFQHRIVRLPIQRNMNSPEDFIEFCSELFGFEKITDSSELVEKVKLRKGTIVVVEDIQNLFLKKIGGFEALKLLFELINSTSREVFWITTSTLYSWNYLERTLSIADYFSFKIHVEKLGDQQIRNIVSKRNRISGYRIFYESSPKDLENKKFRKLDEQEQQEYLRNRFFHKLNDFAASNVSLALIFWLLSTVRVDKNMITVRSFNEPDLSFVATFSMNRIFVLHALIIHDGLAEKQLAEVMNISERDSRLILLSMVEDGIIFTKSDIYFVTPIIFRTIINLLKSKNLIY